MPDVTLEDGKGQGEGGSWSPGDLQVRPDPELLAEGWEYRFVADAQRAAEAVQLYAELGYEVRVVSAQPADWNEECEGCQLVALLDFQTIYTRKGKEGRGEGSENAIHE